MLYSKNTIQTQLKKIAINTIPLKGWYFLFALISLMLCIIYWLIFGSLSITIKGKGVTLQPGSWITQYSSSNGRIKNLPIKSGQKIEEGNLIAEVEDIATKHQYEHLIHSIEQIKNQMALQQNNSQNSEQLEWDLFNAEEELSIVKHSLELNDTYSDFKGKVGEVLVNPGEMVEPNTPLLRIEKDVDGPLLFYAFFSHEEGKKIKIGSDIKIILSAVNENKYGHLMGRVKEISDYPVSEQSLIAQFQNESLVHFMTDHRPTTHVIAELNVNSEITNDYAWSSNSKPSIPLANGMIGMAEVVLEKIKPLYFLFPSKELKVALQEGQ